jgi:2-amino-4-hydroxy-6-hydroxymethyldihydropteridine diphosphokinase
MFVNGVALIRTALGPEPLLALLHRIETRLGRRRRVRWEARVIDLDLLAYEDRVLGTGGGRAPELPHPRLRERAFVLLPLAEVAPGWRHPATGESVEEMIQALAPEDIALVSPLDAP